MCVVLLADADQEECQGFTRLLEQAGYDVHAYTDGLQAWDGISNHPDVLVVNIVFPKGQPHGLALATRHHSELWLYRRCSQFLEERGVMTGIDEQSPPVVQSPRTEPGRLREFPFAHPQRPHMAGGG